MFSHSMRYLPSKIESKWQRKWLKAKTYEPDLSPRPARAKPRAKKPFYNLMMFPYPSAEGLHIGAVRTFSGVDIYGRLKRMQGFDVFEPIGLDGFGIHSENYALKAGKHPVEHARDSEKNFYRQLAMIGNGFAWNERLETYDPDYYKWTQWIFVQMFKRGLAYRKKASVNWCPSCMTVLADEQVIQKSQIPNPKSQTNPKSQIQNHKHEMRIGVCERCDTAVIKKDLEQWFFCITEYAERLLRNLESIDWSEKIKIAQRNWIGKSEGSLISFPVVIASPAESGTKQSRRDRHGLRPRDDANIEVFTTRPDTLFGATYMVLGPEHSLIQNSKFKIQNWPEVEEYIKKAKARTEEERITQGREKMGVELKGIRAINPANKEEIPVWVADYVLGHVGTGAIMAVPAHDDRDLDFAIKYGLEVRPVVSPQGADVLRWPTMEKISAPAPYGVVFTRSIVESKFAFAGEGILFNSGRFDGLSSHEARRKVTEFVGGRWEVHYRLRDWLISRQRYWGPPIPLIFCSDCKKLAENSKFPGLAKAKPQASKIQNSKLLKGFSKGEIENPGWIAVPEKDLPVKLPYIKDFRPTGTDKSPLAAYEKFYKTRCPKCGGEARRETDVSDAFLDSAWYFLRYPSVRDKKRPWTPAVTRKWLPVNMYIGGAEHSVLHLLYSRFLTMVFKDWGLLHFEEPFSVFRAHGLITKDGAKMSKSKGNVVNPDEYIRAYGTDAIRMYLAFLAPFEQGGDFRDTGIKGITRFLERVYKLISNFPACAEASAGRQFPISKQIPNSKSQIPNSGELYRLIHKTIKKVTGDIEGLQYNTAISALMVLLNAFEENIPAVGKDNFLIFLKLLAPFAPHITEELWIKLGGQGSIHLSKWPEADEGLLREEKKLLIIQINGKVRDRVEINADAPENVVKDLVLSRPGVKKWIGAKPLRKFIYVRGRVANIVI